MFLKQRFNKFYPTQFSGSSAGATNSPLLGTTQKWTIDRTWPIEEIWITVNFVVNTGGLTMAPASATTPDMYDNILTLLQHVNLSVNNGIQPRSVVDCNGIALIEYATLTQIGVDGNTQMLIAWGQGTSLLAGNYRITYRLPLVEPWIGEPLRSRMYLPVHTYPQDPVLTLSFQSATNMYTVGNINNVNTEILLIRRQPTAASEAALAADAKKRGLTNPTGYIDWDLIETPFSVAPGISTEQRFPLPLPGAYANLMFRHYLGGANVTRKPIDYLATGASFGNEIRWRIESGSVVDREWRWHDLAALCQYQQAANCFLAGGATVSYPSIGILGADGIVNGKPPVSVLLNYLTDGMSGDNAIELGSLLDCNTPANTGLKMELVGTPVNVATNASYLYVMGRRYFGNLAGWQAFS